MPGPAGASRKVAFFFFLEPSHLITLVYCTNVNVCHDVKKVKKYNLV